jgi:predicted DNA-binding protein (MmcQ/YjbR family)
LLSNSFRVTGGRQQTYPCYLEAKIKRSDYKPIKNNMYKFYRAVKNNKGKYIVRASMNKKHWVRFGTQDFETENEVKEYIKQIKNRETEMKS